MNEPKDPLLLDHEYDGIQELDNSLPRWWVWLFWGTHIFAVVYLGYYHVLGKGDLMAAEYTREMKIGSELKIAAMGKFEAGIPTRQPATDPVTIAAGKKTFLAMCAPCHRPDAGGLVGPNLCDDYWIHGSNYANNVTTIWNGVPAKGMITWKNSLKPQQIQEVASYIFTLRGTQPLNPKPAENTVVAPTGPSQFE